METIWILQKATAMGNWWLAASLWQSTCSCITSCAEVFWQNVKSLRWLSLSIAQIWCPAISSFTKLKSPLKGKRFQTVNEIQESMTGQLMVIPTKDFAESFEQWKRCWENCVRFQGAYFEGDWGVIILCTMFIVSWNFFNKCLYFSLYMARYFLDKSHIFSSCYLNCKCNEGNR